MSSVSAHLTFFPVENKQQLTWKSSLGQSVSQLQRAFWPSHIREKLYYYYYVAATLVPRKQNSVMSHGKEEKHPLAALPCHGIWVQRQYRRGGGEIP